MNFLYVPTATYDFPVREFNGKKLKFQYQWFQKWNWLSYSKVFDGAYFKYCVLFCNDYVGKGSHEKIGSLVAKPFIKWKDAIEKFTSHSKAGYHRFCINAADNFSNVVNGKMNDVATQLISQRKQQRNENRLALKPIIETIIFCGEQEIPLRGDNDSGPFSLQKLANKDGKFRALLRFRANSGDNNLKKHLLSCQQNASCLSPTIQNEIIDICGNLITKKLVTDINKSGCFTILCDKTLDVSGIEQLSLCARYINFKNQLREDFLCFIPVYDLTGENLANLILEKCELLGLDMSNLVGQGYDGAGNMSGQFNGVQSKIRQKYPKAMFVHCAAHKLNLALSSALSISSVRNSLGVINYVINLFRNNALAGYTLKNNISKYVPESKRSRLVGLCETRFIERHDAINVFVELLEPIIISLQDIQETNRSVSLSASSFLAAVEKSSFIISLLVCEYLLNFTLPLSHYLQNPARDLSSAMNYAHDIINKLKHLRNNYIETFSSIFQYANKLRKLYFDSEIVCPRIIKNQKHRDNYDCNTPEEYYRTSIFVPSLDGFILNLENRFKQNNVVLSSIEILLPKFASNENVSKLKNLNIFYEDRTSEKVVCSEFLLWCEKWVNVEKKPTEIMDILDACDAKFYPNIHFLLKILATLPVSTTAVERSFSTLKRLKTLLRNKTGNERLTGLALLSVHWEVSISTDEMLDVMAQKNRKLIL